MIFSAADGMVHAVSRAGVPLAGYPVRIGTRAVGGPAVGDLDRDGTVEVVAIAGEGTVHALGRSGKELRGFPEDLGSTEVAASPLLAELTGDGTLSVFVGLPSGDLHAVRAERTGNAVAAAPWPGPGHDAAHSGRFGPYPPTYKDLRLDPAAPSAGDGLRASWRGVWLDAPAGSRLPPPASPGTGTARPSGTWTASASSRPAPPTAASGGGSRWPLRPPPPGRKAPPSAGPRSRSGTPLRARPRWPSSRPGRSGWSRRRR